jgi:tetratricopeptide (TPR) repeat protein
VLSGDIKAGLESNQKGLAIRAALFRDDPNNADYRRLLAISYQNDGDYRTLLHDVPGALQGFRRKLRLDEQAVAQDPHNAQSRGDLAYSYHRIGYLLAQAADYRQALSFHRKTLTLAEKLSADAPQNLSLRYGAIIARANVVEMQAKLGRRALALSESSKTIDLLNDTPHTPASNWQSSMRAQGYLHLAKAYGALATSRNVPPAEQREHWLATRDMYARSLEIWQDMQKRGILTGEDAAKPQEIAREISKCDAFLRR